MRRQLPKLGVLSSALSVINLNNHTQNGMKTLRKKCADAPALLARVGLSTDAPALGPGWVSALMFRPCAVVWPDSPVFA